MACPANPTAAMAYDGCYVVWRGGFSCVELGEAEISERHSPTQAGKIMFVIL